MKKGFIIIFSSMLLFNCANESASETFMTENESTEDAAAVVEETPVVDFPRAVFTYEQGFAGTAGNFQLLDENGQEVFSVDASAGYKDDANNPYSQGLKDKGPIPNGMWYITEIKNAEKAILRLEPDENTNVLGRD